MNRKSMRARIDLLRKELLNRAGGSAPGLNAETAVDLFISRVVFHAVHEDAEVAAWIASRRAGPGLVAQQVRLDQMERWEIDAVNGNICHETGRFFSLTGVGVRHRQGQSEVQWDQPIIDQPEVGILGILAQRIEGVLHFCLQAKEEPGNLGGVQLSPTVQATYSNYSCAHGGSLPPFVELFIDPPRERMLFAKLQSEDGGRFLYKSNRNMVLLLEDEARVEVPDQFIWLTLRQITALLKEDNLVNACTRSVLACMM